MKGQKKFSLFKPTFSIISQSFAFQSFSNILEAYHASKKKTSNRGMVCKVKYFQLYSESKSWYSFFYSFHHILRFLFNLRGFNIHIQHLPSCRNVPRLQVLIVFFLYSHFPYQNKGRFGSFIFISDVYVFIIMLAQLRPIYYLSYSSTFKLRSRVGEFLKHIHPDQLHQAPNKIKEQNSLSLTNLNSYIDALNQQKQIEGKLLKFYIAEKTNKKSKKFYAFEVELPPIKSDLEEAKVNKLVDSIVEVLNNKFNEASKKNRKSRVEVEEKREDIDVQKDVESEEETLRKKAQNIRMYKRQTQYREEDGLKDALQAKYLQAEKEALAHKLRTKITFADTPQNKSMLWSRMMMEEAGLYNNYQQIMHNFLDPKLIYFHPSLTTEQINQFKERLVPGSLNRESYRASKIVSEVCEKMESFDPPICLYVSTHYDGTEIPGFFTVPYNFKAEELGRKYEQLIDTILEERMKFENFYDYYEQLCLELRKSNNIRVQEKKFKNNAEVWSYVLMAKRLQKYRLPVATDVVPFNSEEYQIFKHHYKIQASSSTLLYNQKLILNIDFNHQDMISLQQEITP